MVSPLSLAFAAFCRSLGAMKLFSITGLLAAALSTTAGASAVDGILTVQAKESTAQLEPRDAEHSQIMLPTLELAILASFDCPADSKASALTISVSDTHQYFGPQQIADVVSLEATFSVPSNQLAPVTIPEFCVAGAPIDDQGLSLPGIATAQVSLRCGSENNPPTVYFTSTSVPVRLYCQPDEDSELSSLESTSLEPTSLDK